MSNMVYGRINITIPKSTLKKLKELANLETRSVSNMIARLVEKEYKNKLK